MLLILLCSHSRLPVEKWFLATVIPFAIIYMVLFSPLSQYDTGSHMNAAYRLSNKLLGYSEADEWKGRREDAEFLRHFGMDYFPSVTSFVKLEHHAGHLLCDSPETVDLPNPEPRMNFYSILCYLPQVLGLTIGRVLNLSTFFSIYLGRILIMLLYVAVMYRNIRKIPCGKWIIATVALFPMSLTMSSALSYDAMVIISSLSFITCMLRLRNERTRGVYIEAALWCFIAGAVKGGGYILILLPLALMIYDRDNKSRSIHRILVLVEIGVLSVLLFDKIIPESLGFQFGKAGDGYLTASFAIHEPLKYLNMALASYSAYVDVMSLNMAGTHLTWGGEPSNPAMAVILLMALGGVLSIFEKDRIELRKSDRWLFVCSIAIGLAAIPAMLLSFTPVGFDLVRGIQGRYFIPMMPLVYYILTKYSLHTPDRANRELIMRKGMLCMSVLVFITVYWIMISYLAKMK